MEDKWRKPMTLQESREALRSVGVPVRNPWDDHPTSIKKFPDGANWRVEISGIESVKVLEATIDEAKNQGVPFHRSISVVRGATLYTLPQLDKFAQVAYENKVEAIITPGPRPSWDTGRQVITPEGALCGFAIRGDEDVSHLVKDISECVALGFRGFLVLSLGVMKKLNALKEKGRFPSDVTFKLSIFAGIANAADAELAESVGTGTFNPKADLAPEMLAEIREATNIPMDIHTQLWDSMGGFNRMYETPEFARVLSPCYFKMEPGPAFSMYMPWGMSEDQLAEMARGKIRSIKRIYDLIRETYPELKVSGSMWTPGPTGKKEAPEDLCVPKYKYVGLGE